MPLDETIESDDVKTITINKLQILFDNVTQAVFLFNFTGKILDVNRTACKLLDYSKEEILKLDLHDIIPPEFISKITKGIKSTLENGKKHLKASLCGETRKRFQLKFL